MAKPAVREHFPRRVEVVENLWLPMPDGCRLAARMWLPEDAARDPVPAILEMIPYRKRDRQAARDSTIHGWLAGHGYACVRLDIRGTGDSDGLIADEYTAQEHDDAVAAIAWLARQPWCSGTVGMMGISWGGFNALQVAARRPPALKAIVTVASSDDRYADDMHYMGGCLLTDTMGWGATFFAWTPVPPDPAVAGEAWRETWLERMERCPLAVEQWIGHQRRDAYWKAGSVCEDYGSIEAAVFAVGGWADGYTNSIMRLLGHLKGPRRGLIGPWGHAYPMDAGPGPSIGFLHEALAWWDRWLKGAQNGIEDEPMLVAWMQEHEPPRREYETRRGRWVAEPVWPPADGETLSLVPNADGLAPAAGAAAELACATPLWVGMAGSDWCPYGLGPDLADDQREEDAVSLCFDSAPLEAPLEILGTPRLELALASDKPAAMIAARLNDVAPDGSSVRVSYGLLNLAHRGGHEAPAPLEPGRRYRVALRIKDCAYAFPAGHRIRVALSTSYWPVAWPSPERATLTVFAGEGALSLPVRRPRPEDERPPAFAPPETAAANPLETIRTPQRGRSAGGGGEEGRLEVVNVRDRGEFRRPDIDWSYGGWGEDRHSIDPADPCSARTENRRRISYARGELKIAVESELALTSTVDSFRLRAGFRAFEGDEEVCRRDWDVTIPRDGV